MKEWTREEVERLVPEWRMSVFGDGDFAGFNDGNRKSIPEIKIIDALLQTRLDLEIVRGEWHQDIATLESQKWEISRLREAFEQIVLKDTGKNPHIRCNEMANIAREALKGHDK